MYRFGLFRLKTNIKPKKYRLYIRWFLKPWVRGAQSGRNREISSQNGIILISLGMKRAFFN